MHTNLITYQGAYTQRDSNQFILYLQNKWSTKVAASTRNFLVDTFGLNYGLIKSAIRLHRFNNTLTNKQLIKSEFIKERARVILQVLPQELVKIMQSKKPLSSQLVQKHKSIIEYLIHTKMAKWQDKTLCFICSYYDSIIISPVSNLPQETHFIEYFLSQKEALVFEELKNQQGKLVIRKRIGDVMWGEEVEELYSEWAIDQVIHRIRKKLTKANLSYELKTKKGTGFILLEK